MKGKLLIASPDLLSDRIFSKAVILISDKHEDGSVGFILNKPLPVTIRDISSLNFPLQAFNGGPVSTNRLYFIHKIPDIIEGSVPIDNDLYWGGNLDRLLKSNLNLQDLQKKIKFFIGYSGWGKNQLQNEINEGAWLVSNKKIDIFSINPKNLWKNLLVETDPDMILWKNAPSDPSLN